MKCLLTCYNSTEIIKLVLHPPISRIFCTDERQQTTHLRYRLFAHGTGVEQTILLQTQAGWRTYCKGQDDYKRWL